MHIPMTDLTGQYEAIKPEIDNALAGVLQGGGYIGGKEIAALEEAVAGYTGVRFGRAVASGTDALFLALVAAGIGKGDEVITTPFTFIATAEAINRAQARPVFCDIDPESFDLDPATLESKITPRTKAVIVVHLYGQPCVMDRIMACARAHQLQVIEDCAQSFGSAYRGKKTGSFGLCGCYSFFPSKTLGCYGDGGMVVTDDEAVALRIASLRNHGQAGRYRHDLHGINSRLDTIQAAVLLVKLRYIDGWIQRRIKNAAAYSQQLAGVSGISVPRVSDCAYHTFNYYTIRVLRQRDRLREALEAAGVATSVHYPLSLHLQKAYVDLGYVRGDFPVSEAAQDEVLSLPMYPELSLEQISHIVGLIKKHQG